MSPAYRVLLTDRAWPDCEIERSILGQVGAEVIEAPASDEATLIELARDCDAIGTCWAPVTPAVIDAAAGCRGIARFGIGLDNISVATATARGIPVTNVPDYCLAEVADHTVALLLGCARKIGWHQGRAKRGLYERTEGPALRRLEGQVVGLVGLGRIGREVCRKVRLLGFEVIAHTLSQRDHGTGCRMVPLDRLLAESDYVSLHLPLSDRTYRLFGRKQFDRMKPTAYLINTSRGGLIDEAALWQALQADAIAGAALDVFDPEPPDLQRPLFLDDRVIVTPHTAFLSAESLADVRTRAAEQLACMLQGIRPPCVVNPEVYDKPL